MALFLSACKQLVSLFAHARCGVIGHCTHSWKFMVWLPAITLSCDDSRQVFILTCLCHKAAEFITNHRDADPKNWEEAV